MSVPYRLCLSLICVALGAAEPQVVTIGGPRLVIDAGTVLPDSLTEVRVEVRNPGAAERTWAAPMLSCSCAALQPEADAFPAAGAGAVRMRVRWPLGHAPAEATAEMRFAIPGDAASKPDIATVTIKGRIEDYLRLDERAGTYRLAPRPFADDGSGWDVDLVRGLYPVAWDGLTAEVGAGLRASVVRIDADLWRVHLVPTAAMPLGSFSSDLVLGFSQGGVALSHRVRRSVVGRISGPMRAVPSEVLLGAVFSGTAVERTVRVTAADGDPVTVLEATVDPGVVTATISPVDPSLILVRAAAPAVLAKQEPVGGFLRIRAKSAAGTYPIRVRLVGTMVVAEPTDTP